MRRSAEPPRRHRAAFYPIEHIRDVKVGDRLLIPCDGGPGLSRLETFPPRAELLEHGGLYVLEDDGPISDWRYRFIEKS
jgi:hypothetical protein